MVAFLLLNRIETEGEMEQKEKEIRFISAGDFPASTKKGEESQFQKDFSPNVDSNDKAKTVYSLPSATTTTTTASTTKCMRNKLWPAENPSKRATKFF